MNGKLCLAMVSILAVLFLGLAGCFQITVPASPSTPASTPSTPTPSPTLPTTQPSNSTNTSPTLPTVNSFSVNPGTIQVGNTSTLSWDVSNASSITITPGIGNVSYLTGSVTIAPTSTTDYTLTASNSAGIADATTEVAVFTISGLPVINYFTATPPSLVLGPSTLSWNVSNATSITITPGVGSVGFTGSTSVTPGATTIYTITASNPAGTVYQAIKVTKIILPSLVPNLPLKPLLPVNPKVITPLVPLVPKL